MAKKLADKEDHGERLEKSAKRQKPLRDRSDTRDVDAKTVVRAADKEVFVPVHTLLKFEDSGVSTVEDADSEQKDLFSVTKDSDRKKRTREDAEL